VTVIEFQMVRCVFHGIKTHDHKLILHMFIVTEDTLRPSVRQVSKDIKLNILNIIKIADIPLSCLAIFFVGSSQC
jgi:hypothetical protein